MRQHLPRIGFVFFIFLLFAANAAGFFRIEPGSASLPSVSAAWPSLSELVLTREFLLLAAIGLLLSLYLPQLEPVPASLLTLASVVPPVYFSYIGALRPEILPMEYYLLMILILFVVNVLISYYAYSHQRQQIIETFSHFVHPEVVRQLCREPDSFTLEGESRELTVLFADLVNFTSIAEQLEPKQLTLLINHYFDVMTTVLFKHGATIDKYIGDSVMAFWGAPLPQENHAELAIRSAFAMQKAVDDINADFRRRDWPSIELCIGINTGMMNVGNVGSPQRASYTVLGDAVNLAARLERLTRLYHVPIIVSESVVSHTNNVTYRRLDNVIIKGKSQPVSIYQPLDGNLSHNTTLNQWLESHEAALKSYLNRNYTDARMRFGRLQSEHQGDRYYDSMLNTLQHHDNN